jgi:aspartate racemase
MKTLGMIGGLGPESTIEYYRAIIATHQERTRDGSLPSLLISSIDVTTVLALAAAKKLEELENLMVHEVEKLARGGADVVLIAANTPHLVFDAVRERSPLPMVSIVEATCSEAKRRGLTKLALLGTRFTMQSRFYADVFDAQGVALVVPPNADQDYVHEKYVGELLKGIILPETRAGLLEVIARLKQSEKIDGVVIGGTELSLILNDGMDADIPFLDTMRIHVRAAVDRLTD